MSICDRRILRRLARAVRTALYYFGLTQLLLMQAILFKTRRCFENETGLNQELPDRVIVISNHRTFMDGIVIALTLFSRPIHFVVRDYYGKRRILLKILIILAGGIFARGRDRWPDLIAACNQALSEKSPILIFPEGEYRYTTEPESFHTGYLRIAIETGARIVPMVSDFNYGLFRRVHLMIGDSMDFSAYRGVELSDMDVNRINEQIRNHVVEMYHELKRRVAESKSCTMNGKAQ